MAFGAVRGGRVYGSYPRIYAGAPLDTGRGRLIPTTSVDELFDDLYTRRRRRILDYYSPHGVEIALGRLDLGRGVHHPREAPGAGGEGLTGYVAAFTDEPADERRDPSSAELLMKSRNSLSRETKTRILNLKFEI